MRRTIIKVSEIVSVLGKKFNKAPALFSQLSAFNSRVEADDQLHND